MFYIKPNSPGCNDIPSIYEHRLIFSSDRDHNMHQKITVQQFTTKEFCAIEKKSLEKSACCTICLQQVFVRSSISTSPGSTCGGAVWVQIAIIDLAKHCFLFSRLQIKGVSSFFVATLPETMALHGKAKKI